MAVKLTAFRGAAFPSAIDDFTITARGPAAQGIAPADLREAAGFAQVDRWRDGYIEDHRVDGVAVRMRRSGWRVEVWGREDPGLEGEPAPDPLPMPEGGEPLDPDGAPVERNARPLLQIADTCADGSPWPPKPADDPAAAASRAAELDALISARKRALEMSDTEVAAALGAKIRAQLGLGPAPAR